MFDGEKLTHSELMEEADRILPKTLRNPEARSMPEYSAILQCVVDLYEAEVGRLLYLEGEAEESEALYNASNAPDVDEPPHQNLLYYGNSRRRRLP